MDPDALGRFINERYHQPGDRLFRLETLPQYTVTSDGDDYYRWLAGAQEPTWSRKQPWLNTLRRERDNGQISQRIRIFSEEVTDYERYSAAFGYRFNGQFEDIRVLHRGEHTIPPGLIEADFWIINDTTVITMHYDTDGTFLNADVTSADYLADYLHTRDIAWSTAEPFDQWWERHPELHRKMAA